ncbi:beta-N-acetylhexosaminidase [Chryseolinea lacunae]|uniref:beta-N-acetylhexosaminidase n=1 Tax=Chryseolinea lacunae TaxID=2801331 RepID=A0ABS1KK66_9BACT|nr:beta-N-acetylhexosaminidase [Chryseolinea lacunae]
MLLVAASSCKKAKDASPEAIAQFQNVIPKPDSAVLGGKAFELTKETTITLSGADVQPLGQYLADMLNKGTGFELAIKTSEKAPESGIFLTTAAADTTLGKEGYTLTVTDQLVTIAGQPAGIFYGLQTLRQLFPAAIEKTPAATTATWQLATGTIRDVPLYAWRGSMLDVARHFFGIDDVKRYIDLISYYKMNILHLHLSDDQGWRIEIKSWPQLTAHGGSTQVGGGKGGFYTQEQYSEIVAYAASRFITVVPEIDMPGHINSALASYGELNGGIQVPKEGRIELDLSSPNVLGAKNKPTQLYTGIQVGFSTLRYDKEETFRFINDVVRELSAITPGPYFHVGGDEAHVTKKDEYIKFVNRFTEIVKANGKKMVGWEEIAQGNIDNNVIVQHWNKEQHALSAIDKGSKLIMSPATKAYLDMQYDSTSRIGLHWAAYIDVDSAYSWDPITYSHGIDQEDILGVEAPLWTETVANMNDIEYLVFPRLPGYAELGWSTGTKSWEEYKVRLGKHAARFKALDIDYYKSAKVPWVE